MDDLLPCPFCGNGAGGDLGVHIVKGGLSDIPRTPLWWVFCCVCLAQGPIARTSDEAQHAWNHSRSQRAGYDNAMQQLRRKGYGR